MSTTAGEKVPELRFLVPVAGWVRHPGLRTPTMWLFVALVAVPPFAAMVGDGQDSFFAAALFAAYFAAAWFLVLHVIVRPRGLSGGVLAAVAALAVLPGMPLALGLETATDAVRHTGNLFASIFLIGVPEELAKMLPVAVVLYACRNRALLPRETLFLGAVAGLAFGAAEAVEYVVSQNIASAVAAVWRIVTDPINHALWAGVSGYFLGLASRYRTASPWLILGGLGLAIPAVLHGINDWAPVTGGFWWGVLTIVSTLLFLAYARLGIAAPPPARPTSPPPSGPVWGPPTAAMRDQSPRSGRHAAAPDDDPITAPIALPARSS